MSPTDVVLRFPFGRFTILVDHFKSVVPLKRIKYGTLSREEIMSIGTKVPEKWNQMNTGILFTMKMEILCTIS